MRTIQYKFSLLFLAVLPLLFSSCAAKLNRQLNWHQSELARAANGNMPASEKLDILMNSFVNMADETLKPINPKKGIKYVKRYSEMNQQHIDKIMDDVQKWQGNMNQLETISTTMSLVQKPYAKKLIELYPKFRRKYNQYKFAMNLTNSITGGLGNVGGKLLKGL